MFYITKFKFQKVSKTYFFILLSIETIFKFLTTLFKFLLKDVSKILFFNNPNILKKDSFNKIFDIFINFKSVK